ncbi:hypothetical protein [Paenibacillus lutrae]|uniref:DNA/RNA helicase n=1 Tax=Paenibacillus lutrae TaxID=2078573 RepID=A0A7X3JZ83_9BACL|nr:hypothetical protein [Paenibacillus lutrae]MVO99797.1 hypothetical protein [Paenibacillus lutrae]
MSDIPIFFEFPQEQALRLAYDTLCELGYRPGISMETAKPTLHIHVEGQDLSSALQIAQASGGELRVSEAEDYQEAQLYSSAYDLDHIRIPAHLVTDPESDAEGNLREKPGFSGRSDANPDPAGSYEEPQSGFDPSNDDYDGFQAGIHI